jgi:hypothetical protein
MCIKLLLFEIAVCDQSLTTTTHPSITNIPFSGVHSAARLSAHNVSLAVASGSKLSVTGRYKSGSQLVEVQTTGVHTVEIVMTVLCRHHVQHG